MKSVALVTVLYNSPEVLEDFFFCLHSQSYQNYKLFIIDNSSNEHSYNECTKYISIYGLQDKIEIIRNSANKGVAFANNQGINKSLEGNFDYTLLLNNDIEFTDPELIGKMVELAGANRFQLLVPKILYHDSKLIWTAGGGFNEWLSTTYHIGDKEPEDTHMISRYVDYAPTCFMLIDNAVFKLVGLMDEQYFVYYDDSDFIWRCKSKNIKVYYVHDCIIEHKVSSSTGGLYSPFSIYYMTRNRLYFARKHMPLIKQFFAIIFLVSSRFIRPWFWTVKGFKSYINGFISGIRLQK